MKCAKCGFDNRSGARFCKRCGEVLQAQATVPVMSTPASLICPACGAANERADARFCLRCGKPLPGGAPDQSVTQPSMPPLPPTPDHPATQPTVPTSRPAPQSSVTTPSPRLPPSVPPSKPKKGLPKWVVWVAVGFFTLACIVALAVVAVFTVPQLLGGGADTGPTQGATETLETTAGASAEAPTAIPTEAPTMPPLVMPPSTPPQTIVAIALSAPNLRKGDLLTVTITITNTEVLLVDVRCQLVADGPLTLVSPRVRPLRAPVEPEQAATMAFVLRAEDVGEASLRVAVTMAVPGTEPPLLGGVFSDRVTVTISAE